MYNFTDQQQVIAGLLTAPLSVRLALAADASTDRALSRILMLDASPEVRQAALRSTTGMKEVQS